MKRFITPGIVALVIAGLALLTGCTQYVPPQSSVTAGSGNVIVSSQQEGIWVSGTGKVSVPPELAMLSLGIEAQQKSVAQAQSEANTAMNSVVSALKAQGVADKDIQTQRFSIQQVTRYDNNTQQQVVVGFRVSNMVSAKIRSIDKTGTVIDAVAVAGGDYTRINGVSFTVEDPTKFQGEARTKAMADAAAKAQQLASLGGVKLGKATYISESGVSQPQPYVQAAFAVPSAAPMPTSISPGEIELTLSVQIAYAIIN